MQPFGVLRRLARQPPVDAVPVLRRYDGHVRNREILVQPVERRARPAPAAYGHRRGRLVGQAVGTGVEQPVQQGAQRPVRPGIVDRRTDHQGVGPDEFLANLVVKRVVEDAAPQFGALSAGDASLHGLGSDRDDLRPDALGFERAGRFGKRDEGVPLAAGTSVDKQYFYN